jgi:hypothetical protein
MSQKKTGCGAAREPIKSLWWGLRDGKVKVGQGEVPLPQLRGWDALADSLAENLWELRGRGQGGG